MSYQKQDDFLDSSNLSASNKKSFCTFSSCVVLVWILANIGFNGAGFVLSLDYVNATCYSDKYIMSLSTWLTIVTLITLIDFGVLLVVILLYSLELNMYKISSARYFIFIVCSAIFYVIVNILGINELLYQYSSCKNEIPRICIVVILVIICDLINIVGLLIVEAITNNYLQS